MSQTNPYQTPQSNVSAPADDSFDDSSPFSPSGRFGRIQYFLYSFGFSILAMLVVGILFGVMVGLGDGMATPSMIIIGVAYIAIIILGVIFAIKRCHDLDWTGWTVLLMIVPIVSFVMSLLLLFKRGSDGANRFGSRPKPPKRGALYIVLMFVLIFVLGIVAAISIPAYQEYVNRVNAAQQSQP